MPFVCRDTGLIVRGTIETLQACYPVIRDGDGWTYSGGPSAVFDEGAEPDTDPETGETLFLRQDGQTVPWSDLEWREDDTPGTE